MRVLVLFLLSVMTIALASAQPPDTLWTRLLGDVGDDHIYSSQMTPDDGFIFTGWTTSSDTSESDLWLLKTDENGNEEWNQTFGGDHVDKGYGIQIANDGGYIILGYTHSFGSGMGDIWLIKTDSEGNEEWNQTYGGAYDDYGMSVIQTEEYGYIVTGWITSLESGPDLCIIKTDTEGEEEWTQIYGGNEMDYGHSIIQTDDGGYILTGLTESLGSGMWDLWLIKTDSEGDEEWNQTYGGAYRDLGSVVRETSDGGFIISGATESVNAGNMDWWLIKTDSIGEEEWSRTYGGNGFDISTCIQMTNDGGYIIGGWTRSFGVGATDVWIIKTDSEGYEQWNQTFGEQLTDWISDVLQTNDGGYLLAGSMEFSGTNTTDAWLIRLGSDTAVIEPELSIPSEYVLDSIYPNPFNSMTTISVALPQSADLKLSVYNINGQEVALLANENHSEGYHQFTFNADNLSSGVYFVHAAVEGKLNQIQKVVLIR